MVTDELLTVKELAAFLKVPPSRIYAWTHCREIPFIKLSWRCLRFSKKEISVWLNAKKEEANGSANVS